MISSLEKLEYKKILNILSTYCKTYVGKLFVNTLQPSNNTDVVKHNLSQTTQALNLLLRYGNAPISEFDDLTSYLKNLESYLPLSPKGLLEIAKILKISNDLKDYFLKENENSNNTKDEKELFNFY